MNQTKTIGIHATTAMHDALSIWTSNMLVNVDDLMMYQQHSRIVRACVEEILDAYERAPEAVRITLAEIPDDKWRNMIETLRHA